MSDPLNPPVIPTAILDFFSSQPDFPAVAGDVAEEFQQRLRSEGIRAAQLWYWRESLRNAFALTARELLRSPGRTILIGLAAVLAVNLATGLYVAVTLDPRSMSAILRGYWIPRELDTILLLQFTVSIGLGWLSGRLLRGREWAVALVFGLISLCIALPAAWRLLNTPGIFMPWALWEFMMAVFALRLSGFWLGALWIRHLRNNRAAVAGVS